MLQLKLGTKGELIIPKKIRDQLGFVAERPVIIELKEKSVEVRAVSVDVIKRCEERAKKWNADLSKLVYGDELYKEIFS